MPMGIELNPVGPGTDSTVLCVTKALQWHCKTVAWIFKNNDNSQGVVLLILKWLLLAAVQMTDTDL